MKFGGIHIMQLPRPWGAEDGRRLLNDGLEIVELSDRVGFDYVWGTEHHFLEEYSHASSPEMFLAAASQRTKNLRLAHGIIHHADRVEVTADAIIRAVKVFAHINAHGSWIQPPTHVIYHSAAHPPDAKLSGTPSHLMERVNS